MLLKRLLDISINNFILISLLFFIIFSTTKFLLLFFYFIMDFEKRKGIKKIWSYSRVLIKKRDVKEIIKIAVIRGIFFSFIIMIYFIIRYYYFLKYTDHSLKILLARYPRFFIFFFSYGVFLFIYNIIIQKDSFFASINTYKDISKKLKVADKARIILYGTQFITAPYRFTKKKFIGFDKIRSVIKHSLLETSISIYERFFLREKNVFEQNKDKKIEGKLKIKNNKKINNIFLDFISKRLFDKFVKKQLHSAVKGFFFYIIFYTLLKILFVISGIYVNILLSELN